MTPTIKKTLGLVAVVAGLILTLFIWRKLNTPPNPINPNNIDRSAKDIGNFDQFQRELAERVRSQLAGNSTDADFSVIVATFAYPLGTLLNANRSIPVSLDDCTPSTPPPPFAAPRLFPAYTLSSNTALAANIGSRALEGLVSAGVNLSQSQNIEYNIADTKIQIMDDKSVQRVREQGNCGNYIVQNPGVRLIRGVVVGKMKFTVKVDNPASVKAELAKIGGFSIDDNPQSSTLSVADQQSEPIVQLLSEFRATSTAPSPGKVTKSIPPGPPSALPPPPPTATATTPPPPHMYVQMDALDKKSSGEKVVALLREKWPSARIESQVEKIPTKNMPGIAEVRYFNESDKAIADRCVGILAALYPNVRAHRIGLPAPAGQLEVWLPKVTVVGATKGIVIARTLKAQSYFFPAAARSAARKPLNIFGMP